MGLVTPSVAFAFAETGQQLSEEHKGESPADQEHACKDDIRIEFIHVHSGWLAPPFQALCADDYLGHTNPRKPSKKAHLTSNIQLWFELAEVYLCEENQLSIGSGAYLSGKSFGLSSARPPGS